MTHIGSRLVLAVALLALVVSVAGAQTGTTSPQTPGASGAQRALPTSANPPQMKDKLLDGPVKQVDPMAKTISVGWLLGLFSTTLEVNEDTRIAIEGTAGSLQDIREGDVVKASYEARDGKNIAKTIEVTEAESRGGASTSARSPAPSSASSTGSPQGLGAPSTGSPKAP